MPVAAALVARIALRRVNISPLGVSRRVTPRPPRARRIIPLTAGIAWLAYLAYFSNIRNSHNSINQAYAYLLGVFGIMIGLVVAGPWLTLVGARLTARRSRRPAGLIAARRLSDNPQSAFRAVSGVVIAVFVGTCTIGIITTIAAYNAGAAGNTANSAGTVVHQFADVRSGSDTPGPPDLERRSEGARIDCGSRGVAAEHVDPSTFAAAHSAGQLVSCAEIVHTTALGHCPDGAVRHDRSRLRRAVIDRATSVSDSTWPSAVRLEPTNCRRS